MTKLFYVITLLNLTISSKTSAQTIDSLRQKIQQIVSAKNAIVGVSIIKITGIVFLVLSLSFTVTVQAQASKEVKDQFLKIMEAFPSGFTTLKNGVPKYDIKNNSFYSKVNISGTKSCKLEKEIRTGKLEFMATIESDEDMSSSVFDKVYAEWKARIASLDFNGVPLVPYTTTKYDNGGEYEMYVKGNAWRLKTEGMSIDKKYFNFTIRLEYLDLEQGGLMVRILITDN